ncbi:MAG: TM2 domain-containing protein [Clostridium sp.]|nr:TM2 domain-containing protein [Clostridium sp.]
MNEYTRCRHCGAWIDAGSQVCHRCGAPVNPYAGPNPNPAGFGGQPCNNPAPGEFSPQFDSNDAFASCPQGSSRGVSALLAIFLGYLGIHYFYMGKTTAGVIFLLTSLLSCGFLAALTGVVALAQGIYMFCMTNRDYYTTYVATNSTLPLF